MSGFVIVCLVVWGVRTLAEAIDRRDAVQNREAPGVHDAIEIFRNTINSDRRDV